MHIEYKFATLISDDNVSPYGYSAPKTTLVLNSYIFILNEDVQKCFSARCRQQLYGTYCTFFRYKF